MAHCLRGVAAAVFLLSSVVDARRIYVAGSGVDMLSQKETIAEIIALSGKPSPRVLYIGTASYDEPSAMASQTQGFREQSLTVNTLDVAWRNASTAAMAVSFAVADIIVTSGGNTLFAVDRWQLLGIDVLLAAALERGAVLSGGSAGFITLCTGGHSDSMSPETYKNAPGPLFNSSAAIESHVDASWAYIRAPGIGVLDTLCCPHYDMTGSNGVPRADDFTRMLQHHSGETAFGLDNWAALSVDGDEYTLIARAGHNGSVLADGSFSPARLGTPGAWQLRVDPETGALERTLVPPRGHLAALIVRARYVAPDSQLAVARAQNPDDGRPAAWNVTNTAPRARALHGAQPSSDESDAWYN